MSLPTIYSSSTLCYLPLLAPDITLRTLLLVSPQYTVLHPCVTFPFWPQISQHPIMRFPQYTVLHPCVTFNFGPRCHSQHPIISLPTIYSSSPPCYLHFWPQISLSAPYYQSPHNIKFFTPLLPSTFGLRYHSQHPIISLPKIYSSSATCYLPLLAPGIILGTLL